MRKSVPGDKKALPVSNVKESNLRPSWRFRHNLNQQEFTCAEPPPQKDVKNEGRSGNVYKTKGRTTKCPNKFRAFVLDRGHFCRKIRVWKAILLEFALSGRFFPGICGNKLPPTRLRAAA